MQKDKDVRNVEIDRVGVKGVSYPVTVRAREGGTQSTVAEVSMSVLLPHEFRGTHMSRFIETLEAYRGDHLGVTTIEAITEQLRAKLDATEAEILFKFPYFIRKAAPVSGIESFMRYDASLHGIYQNGSFDMIAGVEVSVQTLCPCSKEISDCGAHSQRAVVRLSVRMSELVWFEELIEMAERSSSSPLYTLLKREDEKYVTEHAYANPHFVEDVLRDLAVKLNGEKRILWYSISVVSSESIHNHDAFAEITRDKRVS